MTRPPEDFRWERLKDEGARLFEMDEIARRDVGTGVFAGIEFLHVEARSIINKVPAQSRMPFRYTINVYRGCSHACTYCFARPTHRYLNLGIGTDFERKIVVKSNAVERVRAELASPRWDHSPIAMGTNTDPYQLAEGKYHLTQGVIEELTKAANPFSILTKSTLIVRDLRLLVEASKRCEVSINFSIGTLDRAVWKLTEPGTPPPEKRLAAIQKFRDSGVNCGVLIAPVIPGLSDSDDQISEVVKACVEAGADSITAIPLHLRSGVDEHYFDWLSRARPDLVELHRARFSRSAYQNREVHERVDKIVRAFSAPGRRRQVRSGFRSGATLAETSRRNEADQLALDLFNLR
jgi:DNA repair photolyase